MGMKRVGRTVLSTLATLALAAGCMALQKFAFGGSLLPHCYTLLFEFCNVDCWVGRPLSSFPLRCDQATDIAFTVLVNLGLLLVSLCVALCAVLCVNRYCCCRDAAGTQAERDTERYKRLYDEDDDDGNNNNASFRRRGGGGGEDDDNDTYLRGTEMKSIELYSCKRSCSTRPRPRL